MSISGEPTDYEKYLASVHARLETPDKIIQEIVKEGTGLEVVSKKKIVAGEANEVYDISTNNQQNVILRISPHGSPDFQQEVWAIDAARKVGVPAPTIFLVKYVTISGQDRSMCLMEKLDGESLERGGIDFGKLDPKVQRDLIVQGGEILSRIHSIKTEGIGWIVGVGEGQYASSDELIDNLVGKRDQFERMASSKDFDEANIGRALDIIESYRSWYSSVEPRLNHGDYGHKHFMMKDNRITGIIDWGGVRSDTPIYDIAMWDYWFGEYIPTEWLKEGYVNKELFGGNFEDVLHMLRLFKGLEILDWYHQQAYKPAVEKAKAKLLADLDYFKKK